jgi:hypothetical protein
MSKEQQLQGITPYVLRLASHYACLGIGTYKPNGYAQFNRVEVTVKQPWQPSEHFTQSCLILEVAFYQGDTQTKYVEFALSPAGFGGTPIVKVVT